MSKKDEAEGGVAATLSDTYEKVSDKVATAYASARDKAADMTHGTASGIDASPLLALLGGLALGAIAGALAPRSEKERELLSPVGGRLADAARAAFAAAREAGTEALGEAGISQDNLRTQSSNLVEQLVKAAGAAGRAGLDAARDTQSR